MSKQEFEPIMMTGCNEENSQKKRKREERLIAERRAMREALEGGAFLKPLGIRRLRSTI
jgi:hypothetical protein